MAEPDEIFDWQEHLAILNKLLVKWRYIRDMGESMMPVWWGCNPRNPKFAADLKKIAVVQIDLLQSAAHNIEHEIVGITCDCKRQEVPKKQ